MCGGPNADGRLGFHARGDVSVRGHSFASAKLDGNGGTRTTLIGGDDGEPPLPVASVTVLRPRPTPLQRPGAFLYLPDP